MQPAIEHFIQENYKGLGWHDLSNLIRNKFQADISDDAVRKLCTRRGWTKPSLFDDDNYERNLFMGCAHIPYHDKELHKVFIKFLKFFKPHKLWIMGDYLDWYHISKYIKNPRKSGKLQEDLDLAGEMLDELVSYADEVLFMDGNHEDRLQRYLHQYPELYGLRCLTIPALLELHKKGIKYCGKYRDKPTTHHGFVIHHGLWSSIVSGVTAKKHFTEWGGNGIIVHCHKGGNYLKQQLDGIHGYYEGMCMCNLELEYTKATTNWIQGWSIAYFTKKDLFHLEQIPVVQHEFLFQGKLFSE